MSGLRLLKDGYQVSFSGTKASITTPDGVEIALDRVSDNMFYLRACRVTVNDSCNDVAAVQTPPTLGEWSIEDKTVDDDGNVPRPATSKSVKPAMDIMDMHDKYGHKGEGLLRKTASFLEIKLTGSMKSCEGCGLAKAKQKNVSKTTNVRADKPGARLFVDTSGPYPESLGGRKYWF